MVNDHEYKKNDYLQGTCPKCGEWEAPITTKELMFLKDVDAHHGSSTPTRDKAVKHYVRQKWKEYFECPNCHQKFSVPYSNV